MKQYALAHTTNPNVSLLETLNFQCLLFSLFILFYIELQHISAIRHNCFLTVRAAVDTSAIVNTVIPYLHLQAQEDKPQSDLTLLSQNFNDMASS